jgi:hypothetical protein
MEEARLARVPGGEAERGLRIVAISDEGSDLAKWITARGLELHDLGTEVGEDAPAHLAGLAGPVHDAHALQ